MSLLDDAWIKIQQKTFTKWMNGHLRKRGFTIIENAQTDFDTGIKLMQLVNALYGLDIPKHNKDPKMRPHKLDNIAVALNMVEKAEIKTNFLKTTHLIDHDLKMILGMIWAIILDYQIKGVSEEQLTAKEGLLLWCQKKTQGYRDVKVENFSTSWQNGLAFLALIHRHRPDLVDYEACQKENAKENLELAFDIAESKLGIPRLLDVEDIIDVPKPDEKSVMTYVSEYFHCFASQDVKEKTAARVQKFVQFNRSMEAMEADYEAQAKELLAWIEEAIAKLAERNFEDSPQHAQEVFEDHKAFLSQQKPEKSAVKLDLESLFVNIQTKLRVYGRKSYEVPEGLSTDDIQTAWNKLEDAERERGAAVRNNMYRFITKATHNISPEQISEFEAAFHNFDKDQDGHLSQAEFQAALSSLGIPFKDEQAFLRAFQAVSEGSGKVSKDQFVNYLIGLNEEKDTAEAIKGAFLVLSDGKPTISRPQFTVHPLNESEVDYLANKMPAADGCFDFNSYTDSCFQ